jgi:hypothetical protein
MRCRRVGIGKAEKHAIDKIAEKLHTITITTLFFSLSPRFGGTGLG